MRTSHLKIQMRSICVCECQQSPHPIEQCGYRDLPKRTRRILSSIELCIMCCALNLFTVGREEFVIEVAIAATFIMRYESERFSSSSVRKSDTDSRSKTRMARMQLQKGREGFSHMSGKTTLGKGQQKSSPEILPSCTKCLPDIVRWIAHVNMGETLAEPK